MKGETPPSKLSVFLCAYPCPSVGHGVCVRLPSPALSHRLMNHDLVYQQRVTLVKWARCCSPYPCSLRHALSTALQSPPPPLTVESLVRIRL